MIGASKILTVSYGTFSCTLEGFDDSFGTMKAIAEYFRDLASDDRYFGAEPATPDAEMLAKIAGHEIQRRVEAKVEDNGVTLRPMEQAADAAPVEPSPEPALEPIIKAQPVVEEVVLEEPADPIVTQSFDYDDAQDDARAELVTADAPIEPDMESVAAKLRRIRAVVAKNEAAGSDAPVFSEDQHADSFLAQEDVEEEAPETEAPEAVVEVAQESKEVSAEDTAEEITEAPAEEDMAEDTLEDATDVDISAMMGRVADEVAEGVEAPKADEADAYDEVYEEDDSDNAVSNILNQVAISGDVDDNFEEDSVEDDVTVDDTVAQDVVGDDIVENTDDNQEELIVAADEENTAKDEAADTEQASDVEQASDEITEDAPQALVTPVRPSRARIIKVKRADLQRGQNDADKLAPASVEDTTKEDPAEAPVEVSQDTALDPLGETNLSAEDEAELLADLADVEMETPTETDTGIDAALRVERTNRALHNEGGAEDEASVSRLLDEADAKLKTDESSRRRSAISHLRAAVAATVADRKFNKANNIKAPDEVDPYRTDLADVMRPQPVKAKGSRNIDRPAPLILVSEQRIDGEEDENPSVISPVRPRRISKNDVTLREVDAGSKLGLADLADTNEDGGDKDGNIFADSTSFADFAEKMGATELPDLLEAAAAYTAYVEGRPHFGRPQIMRQVAGFSGKDEFNREEGLRSFGQLLRQGKIIKVNRGKFEIAETTRFKPEARFAGE